jgi:hypothetical protein
MNSDELAVRRAAWAVEFRNRLKQAAFTCKEHLNDYSTMLMVTHADSPGWKVKVALTSRRHVRVEMEGFPPRGRISSPDKVFEILVAHRLSYDTKLTQAKATEAAYRYWHQRQQTEMAGLAEIRGVDVQIIPGLGRYVVIFEPGHPLEQLTLEQFKTFHAFLRSLRS